MRYFIKANEYGMNMHPKIHYLNLQKIVVTNFFKFCIQEILYNAIMHKCRFGQAYCIDLLKRILRKFIVIFLNFIQISMYYGCLYHYLEFKLEK
jgi:hypothetical protein